MVFVILFFLLWGHPYLFLGSKLCFYGLDGWTSSCKAMVLLYFIPRNTKEYNYLFHFPQQVKI